MNQSIFVAHGAPTLVFENNKYTEYLKQYAKTINKPKAIIIFSAHWESDIQLIGAMNPYNMIYDFYGFPQELYEVNYPASSDSILSKKIQSILTQNNIDSKLDFSRGIDHGAWSVLKLMFPNIDIPVITMSVNPNLPNKSQYEIGKALSPLKDEDILIIASGGIVHNLGMVDFYKENTIDSWALHFNNWIKKAIEEWDTDKLFNYESLAPSASLAVPRNEHFIPLLIAMGAGDYSKDGESLISTFQYGNLALDLFRFS